MNKRKKKKLAKKQELFIINFSTSYREVKNLDRSYHEYILAAERKQRYYKQHNIEPPNTFDF